MLLAYVQIGMFYIRYCTYASYIASKPFCDDFSKLHALWRRNMCVKVSDTVLPPITGLCITFGKYMEALGTMGR